MNELIKLISYTYAINDVGDSIPTPTESPVYARKLSIRQSEFYQAQATGLRPEIMFEVWTHEYSNQPSLEYNGVVYDVFRTFDKDKSKTELICKGLVNASA